jgi:hypothetical protein
VPGHTDADYKGPEARYAVINSHVSRAEAEAVAAAAAAAGLTRSRWLRQVMAEALSAERAARAVAALPSLIVSPSTSSAGAASVNVEGLRAA